jgi:hypothetical protein
VYGVIDNHYSLCTPVKMYPVLGHSRLHNVIAEVDPGGPGSASGNSHGGASVKSAKKCKIVQSAPAHQHTCVCN